MDKLRVISADSYMTEPPDLWIVRLDRRFQEQAPRGVRRPDKPGHFFPAPGITPFPVAGGFSTGNYRFFGAENCMWTSDFPHTATTWPNSRRVIARDFVGVPARITRKIVSETAARLYRIELE